MEEPLKCSFTARVETQLSVVCVCIRVCMQLWPNASLEVLHCTAQIKGLLLNLYN